MDARVSQILADTKAFGFEFVSENLAKHDVELRGLPVIHVLDTVKFDTIRPGVVREHINHTSTHIGSQRVSRDFAYENQRMPIEKRDEAIRRKNVEWLLDIKVAKTVTVVVEKEIYLGPGGTRFESADEAEQAWAEYHAKM